MNPQQAPPEPNRERPGRVAVLRYLAFTAAATAVATMVRLANMGVPEPDSFYHFRHAAVYAEKGLFSSAFPWLPYSPFSRFPSDIGYGFHLFLAPFTRFQSQMFGLQMAPVAEIAIMMVLLYATLRRHRIAYPFAWPFVVMFGGPTIVWMLLQTRPQTLTMGLSALLLSSLVTGSAPGTFVCCLAIGFIHLNIVPVVPVIVAGVAIVKGLAERRWEWRVWAAALGGAVAGLALRPNALGAAKLEWVQIALHESVRLRRIPIAFGEEWPPLPPGEWHNLMYLMAIWAGVTAILLIGLATSRLRVGRQDRTFLWGSFALSVIFLIGTVGFTQRAAPFLVVFAVVFTAKAFSSFLDPRAAAAGQWLGKRPRAAISLAMVLLVAAMVREWSIESSIPGVVPMINPYRMQTAARWLREHGPRGKIVYNASWDMFPELFFWNPDDRYVWGLDPIFLYEYDSDLYWKAHHLGAGEATSKTWGYEGPLAAGGEDTYMVLRRDFGASAIIVEPLRHERLYRYLSGDPRYSLGVEGDGYAVFGLAPG
ncbi:MAG: hypothetical protein ACE149_14850 [Armatimonadota bacterium]